MLALADTVAHARLYPKQKQDQPEKERGPKVFTPQEAMAASFPPLPPGITQEKLEALYRGGARSNLGVPEIVSPSASTETTKAS